MSYLPTRTELGAVPAAGWGVLALVAVAVGVVALWPSQPKKKSWLSYNTQSRRACQLASTATLKPPPKQISC